MSGIGRFDTENPRWFQSRSSKCSVHRLRLSLLLLSRRSPLITLSSICPLLPHKSYPEARQAITNTEPFNNFGQENPNVT